MSKRFPSIVRLLLALALVASLVAVTAAPASAQTAFTNAPAPAAAPVGASVTLNIVAVDGFLGDIILSIRFDGAAVTTAPATVKTDATGAVTCALLVPAANAGLHQITATDGVTIHGAPNNFTVLASTHVTAVGFTASPPRAGAYAQYAVGFTTSAMGALTANVDIVTIQFPAGVTLPATIPKAYVSVGTTVTTVDPVVNQVTNTIHLITPVAVAASTAATVTFAQVAKIENPDFAAVANFYVGYVNTSQDTTPMASVTYSAITTDVIFTPALGPVGTAIKVMGVGFGPSMSVDITDAGSVVIGTGTTTGTGTFDVTAYAATTSTGTLTATDGAGNTHTTTATFTVTPTPTPTPVSVTLGATSGYPGQGITANGSGWAPGAVIAVTLAGSPVTTSPSVIYVGQGAAPYPWAPGTWLAALLVPEVPVGVYTGVNGLRFTDGVFVVYMDFTVVAAVDEYFVYSSFDPPGIGDVVAVGGYVEYYGIPDVWGDEIQYLYFLSGTTGYKVKVWVTDGDGDGVIEPRQHPDHYLSDYVGPIEPRQFEIVSSANLAPYAGGSGWHTEEFYIDSSGVFLGAYPNGIHKWDHDWNYIGKIANSPPERTESMAYNAADNVWYAGGRYRTIYQLGDTDGDGSFLDESWVAIFTYPNYGGDHHDGMEYVGGYLWISDMTSDVIGKWQYDPDTSTWMELERFTYSEPASVEGMGFGPNDHFWSGSGWGSGSYIYELGNEITRGYPIANAGPDVEAYPPTMPVTFDASSSHHTDIAKEIVLYEWDFESDGTWDYSGSDLVAEHAYPAYYLPDGSIDWSSTARDYTATLRVTDNSDPTLVDTDTCVVHITAPPWKPVANPGGPYEGWEGSPIVLDASESYDPESIMFPPSHPWYETISTYEWDLDYDGQFDDSTDVNPSWTWESKGIYIVGLRVTDSQPSGPGGSIGPLDFDIKHASVIIEEKPFVRIDSEEDTWPQWPDDWWQKAGRIRHILALNIEKPIDEAGVKGLNDIGDLQNRIDQVTNQGENSLAIIAHPNAPPISITSNTLSKLNNYIGIEVFNALLYRDAERVVWGGGHDYGTAFDKWDSILSAGRLIWGIATDDAHKADEFDKSWIMLQTTEFTKEGILNALRSGSFYAVHRAFIIPGGFTTDPITDPEIITHITLVGDRTIQVQLREPMNIIIKKGFGEQEELLNTEFVQFTAKGDEKWIRMEITEQQFGGLYAYTQPSLVSADGIITNPYESSGNWYKGQLHSHSTRSDGELAPDEVAARYRQLGYDFLAITDHNRITDWLEASYTYEDAFTHVDLEVSPWLSESLPILEVVATISGVSDEPIEYPVINATVTGYWKDEPGDMLSKQTGEKLFLGQAIFDKRIVEPGGTYTFVVNDVSKAGWKYNEGNVEASITVPSWPLLDFAKEAVSTIDTRIQSLISFDFRHSADTTEQRKNAFHEMLTGNDEGDAVLQLIEEGNYQRAIEKLRQVRAKMDGNIKPEDWIVNPEAQLYLCGMIDGLIAYLETLL